ncbi:hypothetical protein [Pantoea sp. UBA5035]|uniref:hypothetical protein n=2 Tax=unclassified Pantoea TaxID=2630326 RepID=UPI00257FA048|nr:hypothetical protein [Pantoea sp. UBA5035]MDU5473413.1 hypothetical protein [Pantoea sp.]
MENNSNEKMTNIVIGEAVMQLVSAGADISWRAVTETLQLHLKMEQDSERLMAMRHALNQVHDELRAHYGTHGSLTGLPSAERFLH